MPLECCGPMTCFWVLKRCKHSIPTPLDLTPPKKTWSFTERDFPQIMHMLNALCTSQRQKTGDNCFELAVTGLDGFSFKSSEKRNFLSLAKPTVIWIIKELKSLPKFLIQLSTAIKTKGKKILILSAGFLTFPQKFLVLWPRHDKRIIWIGNYSRRKKFSVTRESKDLRTNTWLWWRTFAETSWLQTNI